VLILAQSAATSRAYAAKYNEAFSENVDLIGLGVASLAAGISGAFPVNGSPTKTQMVDGAGGRSQLAQLTTGVLIAIVLLFLTAPIQYMPKAVLASVVFLIGIELIDIAGMRRVLRVRPDEFVVAAATAATVVVIGVEQGIVLAIVLSIIDHLRRSYHPNNGVLSVVDGQRVHFVPVEPTARSIPGLVVYRFAASLYYANANRFMEDITGFVSSMGEQPISWLCIDASAMTDIDYTGAETIKQANEELHEHGVRLVFADVMAMVRPEFDRYGLTDTVGADAFYVAVTDVLDAFNHRQATS
jgi:MFS superfamily sulfate permease-like transporter